MLVWSCIGDRSDKHVRLGLEDWKGQKATCGEVVKPIKGQAGDRVVEGYLFHLYTCWNVVFTWDTSGL